MIVVLQVVIRHLLSAIGASALVSDGDMQQIAGAVMTVCAIAWSLYQKREEIKARQD